MEEHTMIRVIASKNKKNPLVAQMNMLAKIRTALINNDIAKEICADNNIDEDILRIIPIDFGEDEVTAKTVNASISLNPKLIEKPFNIVMRYVIHEFSHCIQHIVDYGKDDPDKSKDYLNKEDEIEAFQYQIKFDAENRGKKEAENYVDKLLEYHDLPDTRREDKKDELLEMTHEE